MKLRSGLRTPERGGTRGRRRRMNSETLENGDKTDAKMSGKKVIFDWPNIYIGKHRINGVVATVHFNIFLYATAFFIQLGVLPYLNKKLGADPITFGYLQTVFAVVQLAGGPPFGRFGDLFGGRAALVLAFAACAASYGIMSVTYVVPLLFLSRIPSAFMHAMQGGQMIITDMTEPDSRADALGKLSFSYGIGMICGPFIGGLVTKFSGEQFAAFVAFLISVFSAAVCLFLVPAKTKQYLNTKQPPAEEKGSEASIFSVKKYLSLLKNKEASLLLSIKVLLSLPLGIFQSMFSVMVIENFKLTPEQNGYLMSYTGFLLMIMQGLGVGILLKRFDEKVLIKWASFALIWAWLLMAQVQNTWQFCLVIIPHCVAQVIINIIITSTLTNIVSDADSGSMLGMNMAMHSLVRAVSPTTGGYMLHYWGFASFGYLGTILSAIVTIYLFTSHSKK